MRPLRVFFASWLLTTVAPARASGPYAEVKSCRPPEEESEFLQSCVRLTSGRHAGKTLGPGLIAPSGGAAAVLHHRRYGGSGDRITVKLYGADGKLQGSFPMGTGADEFPLFWSPPPSRYLAWIEVDGRGGTLRIVDVRRRRLVLSQLSPLEEWPVFSPKGSLVLIPLAAPGPTADAVREVAVVDLASRRTRQVVLRSGPEEELVQPKWLSERQIGATLRKRGEQSGRPVQATIPSPARAPAPPEEPKP